MTISLLTGDCCEVLKTLGEASVDAIVTDPPYGIRFMGKAWDGQDIERQVAEWRSMPSADPQATDRGGHKSAASAAGSYDFTPTANQAFQLWTTAWAREALRVLKPGGYLLCFAGTRTYHRMAGGVEDAGYEIRDQIGWAFGSGFPKSHNGDWGGTALKPAWEPIVLARKPLIGTVEANWMKHGTGALNIDGCRIQTDDVLRVGAGGTWDAMHQHEGRVGEASAQRRYQDSGGTNFAATPGPRGGDPAGRWPANLIHDGSDEVVSLFPREAGVAAPVTVRNGDKFRSTYGAFAGNIDEQGSTFHGDTGSAARFFYCAKASKEDRDEGLSHLTLKALAYGNQAQAEVRRGNVEHAGNSGMNTVKMRANTHPTVKPTNLMRWLVRLVTPKGGIVLDPFMGSGSTGKAAMLEDLDFIGIELSPEYVEIARARIDFALRQGHQPSLLEAA